MGDGIGIVAQERFFLFNGSESAVGLRYQPAKPHQFDGIGDGGDAGAARGVEDRSVVFLQLVDQLIYPLFNLKDVQVSGRFVQKDGRHQ